LCVPYPGSDPAVTLKIYPGFDADNDPTNNLCRDPGCGEIRARAKYVVDGQTIYRPQPAPVADFWLRTAVDAELAIDMGDQTGPLTIRRLNLACTLPELLTELRDGMLCGVAPVRQLAHVQLAFCEWLPTFCNAALIPPDLSLAEYLAVLGQQPDIDVDGDGLERFELDSNNRVLICYDGDGSVMGAKDCMQDPALQDGYSICFDYHGIPGAIVGVEQ